MHFGVAAVRKQAAHGKAIADPMRLEITLDVNESF
jgi:hypothetical protein